MSKIICDICGTTYPETAAQCPICGCAKNTTNQTAAGENAAGETPYTYVKGGRFSKSNVRKRAHNGGELKRQSAKTSQTAERQPWPPQRRTQQSRPRQQQNEMSDNTNKILAAVIVLLMLAIVAVLCYMGARIFFPNLGQSDNPPEQNPGVTESTSSTESTGSSESLEIPCIGLTMTQTSITLEKVGDGYLLAALPTPENTTDAITFSSSDPAVATVSETGLVKAVSGGRAVITATCGSFSAQCEVLCSIGDATESTESTESTTPPVTEPAGFVLKLNRTEFALTAQYPNPWALYKETDGVKPEDIIWSVDNPNVASVSEKGVVSAVGRGSTVVRATYGDQTVSCKVYVQFDPQPPQETKYKLTPEAGEVTLYVGDSNNSNFRIELSDRETGAAIPAEWTASDEGYVTIDGKIVSAVKATSDLSKKYITLTATVEGETYTFIVRIAEKKD